jgi:hypothetical protein
MNNLFDIITGSIDEQTIETISKKANLSPAQTKDISNGVLGTIFSGLAKQAANPDKAQAITQAAKDHDSSILDNITRALQDGSIDLNDGKKILGHIFGSSQNTIASSIAKETGVQSNQIGNIMEMLAPLALSAINKGQTSTNGNNLIELLTQSGQSANDNSSLPMQIVTSLLDQNGDGSLDVNDVISAVTGGQGKKKSG